MKDYKNAAVISEAFMNLPEVKAAKRKFGLETSGLILEITLRMKHWKNGIGTFDDLKEIGDDVKKYASSILRWMRESKIYQIDEENHLFYSRRQRYLINKPADPTPEEIYDIQQNGNIYKGAPKGNRIRSAAKGTSANAASGVSRTAQNQYINYKETTKNYSSTSQNADNQEVGGTLITNPSSILSDIILKDNNIRKGPRTNQNKSCAQDLKNAEKSSEEEEGGGEKFYFFREKIFSSEKWVTNISKIRDIDLQDKQTADIFADWMYSYCIANQKMPRTVEELEGYAFRLLDKRKNTRKMFDEYKEKRDQEISHQRNLERIKQEEELQERRRQEELQERRRQEELEKRRKREEAERDAAAPYYKDTKWKANGTGKDIAILGYRYTKTYPKQIVPAYAVPQPNAQMRWSYIKGDWIAPEDYHKPEEVDRFHVIRDEILRKREERRRKRTALIKYKADAYRENEELKEQGIEACCIYDRPLRHPNRKHKKYRKKPESPQFMFRLVQESEDDFYEDIRSI